MRKKMVLLFTLFLFTTACSISESATPTTIAETCTVIPTDVLVDETTTEDVSGMDRKKTAQVRAAIRTAEASINPKKTISPTITRRPTATPTLSPTALPILGAGWELFEVRSLCLSIQQEYPEFETKQDEPIEEALVEYLGEIGITVVGDPQTCDASLGINLTGTATASKYYLPGENKQCFSGNSYQGEMRLSTAQTSALVATIHRTFIPTVISACYEEPNQNINWTNGWKYAVLDGIGQIWGKDSLLLLMVNPSLNVSCHTAIVISEWKNLQEELDSQDVPVLLTRLQKCPEEISRLLQLLGPNAWDAIPDLLDAWEEIISDSDIRSTFYNDALRKITETFQPRPFCNFLSCWKTWWGAGKSPP
jgi:hypothetical protein